MISHGPGADLDGRFQPFGQTGGVPVQNDFLEKRTADEHDQPVAVKCNGLAGGGHVIKIGHTVTEPAPNRLEAVKQNQRDFADLEFADVFETFGKTRVNVVTINAVAVAPPDLFLDLRQSPPSRFNMS